MLSAYFTGMHRYTRSSRYVNRKKMKQTIRASRPGNQGFHFTGDFPEAEDWTPVEATRRPRSYTSPAYEGGVSDAVSGRVSERLPTFSRYGVRMGMGVALLTLWVALLCGVLISAYSTNAGLSKRLAQQAVRMETLSEDSITLQSEIAKRCSGVNIRQEAVRIGLTSSRGMAAEYVSVPASAVIDPASYGLRTDVGSVFGQ